MRRGADGKPASGRLGLASERNDERMSKVSHYAFHNQTLPRL